ncbi:ABC transporter ATP-binding protein (plasmid) [Acuticoccus sp. MNP-M23]|uniref:ABC transporter ATP-binding protein n=1 Tax=Acuticoccus sp. MNP-M23 TaxID=3072793 RepID=UPI002814F72C|nr:ABC transporter ATP-binding protein [Acuticoccus sp. MNP-M23]WMS45282.1 ABC transporter ATP-binding protein [Acuticoccus sp. MNP-M23]
MERVTVEQGENSAPFVEIEGLTRIFSGEAGVRDVSLRIPRGAFVVLLGPSGCGKSTTLRLLAGLEDPDAGRIVIDGEDVTALPPSARNLSMVFQSYALFPHLSVVENIEFGLRVRGVRKAERRTRLADALSLTGLEGLERRKPAQLSGGQRQRVALARAVVAGHPLCLMDEPLSNLDAKLRHAVRRDIRSLQQRLGMTVVYVTHDQTEAMSMADIVVLMNGGRIEQAGPPAELYANPASRFVATFLGAPPMQMLPPAAGEHTGANTGVRAEDLRLVGNGDGRLQVRVTQCEFLGAETFVYVETGANHPLIVRAPGRVELAAGTPLGLDWAADAAHRFTDDGARLSPSPAA